MKTRDYQDKISTLGKNTNPYNWFKGYVLFELDDIFQCYRLQAIEINHPNDYYEKYVITGVIEDNITSACELDKLTKSVAYSNALHEYKNLINDIKNKHKELQNLKDDIKKEENRLKKVIQKYKNIMNLLVEAWDRGIDNVGD